MNKLPTIFILFCAALRLSASTAITSSSISGHWLVSGSPFLIYNDITVLNTQTLQIDPGVDIIFQGPYQLLVNGTLLSNGTASQPINYFRNDTTGWADTSLTAGGWRGIVFTTTSADLSVFTHCNIRDLKHGTIDDFRPIFISDCNFYHNKNGCIRASGLDTAELVDIARCSFYDNRGDALIRTTACRFYVHNNLFFNNVINSAYRDSSGHHAQFDQNELYLNSQSDTASAGLVNLVSSNASVSNNKIYKNLALTQGAISCKASAVIVNANIICNNKVLVGSLPGIDCRPIQGGGAIRIDDASATTYRVSTVRNNIIANNFSAFCGAGIYIYGANVNVFNNDIVNNVATRGGGMFVFDTATTGGTMIKIKDNAFHNNVDLFSGIPDTLSLYSGSLDSLLFEYNCTQHAFYRDATFLTGYTLSGDTSKNIVAGNPGFIAPTVTTSDTENALTANFGLSLSSPCVNAGDTTQTFQPTFDYMGNTRVVSGIVDIGAIESPYLVKVEEINSEVTLPFYPNPAKNKIVVRLPEANGTLYLTDISGKLVATVPVSSTNTPIDLTSMPKGTYFLAWENGCLKGWSEKLILE